jgi:hypothetical protein
MQGRERADRQLLDALVGRLVPAGSMLTFRLWARRDTAPHPG